MLRDHALSSLRRELEGEPLVVESGRELEGLADGPPCAAAWIELESLDGIDTAALAAGVLRRLRPGGRLVAVLPGSWPLGRLLERALRGAGEPPSTRTPLAGWRRRFEPGIAWRSSRALGLLVWPSARVEGLSPLTLGLLASAEAVLARRFPTCWMGEWIVHEGTRR